MKKVLIVDDELEIRNIFEEVFRYEYNFEEVAFAKDGLEAFNESSKLKYDIITLDHNMPYVKGADFLIALRSKEGPNQHTPVVLISAHLPELGENIKNLEKTFFMDKPVDFKRLAQLVKDFTGQ